MESKWFVAATEGETADGRVIEKQWLIDMAESYDPTEYNANIFLDHFRWYGNFGDVMAVKLDTDDKDRTVLLAKIDATPNLLQLHQQKQYKYPSLGINRNFKNTGKAYLDHLAAVIQPASIGTQTMQFSHDDGIQVDVECFASSTAFSLEVEPSTQTNTQNDIAPSWFNQFVSTFFNTHSENTHMNKSQLEQFKAMQASVEKITTQLEDFRKKIDSTVGQNDPDTPTKITPEQFNALSKRIDALVEQFNTNKSQENPSMADQFASLESTVTKLQKELADALSEHNGDKHYHHQGADDGGEFSIF